jgi:Na+-transporting methylmalonyl-CoA/oxaloacetate decarboxylase gamma subunit
MTENLSEALQITVIGMVLVFAGIIALWLMMRILMRLTAEQAEQEAQARADEHDIKQRAAVAAVAVLLAREQDAELPHAFPLPPTAIVTAWQAVQRGRLLSQKGPRK